jgi:uncharacterized protein with PQ loop repeat
MKPFLEGGVYALLFSTTVAFTAFAQLWQLQKVILSTSVEGVSATTFILMSFNSFIGALYGVKQGDVRLVIGVGIGSIAALFTVIVTLVRGGSF